jgi:hypothetical protein
LARAGNSYACDLGIFHEGGAGVIVGHDKALQQRFADAAGFRSLRCAEAASEEDALAAIADFNAAGITAVGKINSGSQGCGVRFFPPGETTAHVHQLHEMRADASKKYGASAEQSLWPIRFFEFCRSSDYRLNDGGHLWDLRMEVHVSPNITTAIPATMRLCPSPFDGTDFHPACVVSNVSGRTTGSRFLRMPFAAHDQGKETELEWCGVGESRLAAAAESCARWSELAVHGAI